MSSEIEIVEEDAVAQSNDRESTTVNGGNSNNGIAVVGEDNLKNDVYTAAAYGDSEKLQRLVESERCYVSVLDNLGYYADAEQIALEFEEALDMKLKKKERSKGKEQ